MFKNIVKYVLVALYLATVVSAEKKDENEFVYLPICKRDNPELNECVKNATIALKDRILKGIPELNMKPLDPLFVPNVRLEQVTKSLAFKAVLMDLELHGLSHYEFKDVDIDLDKLTMQATVFFNHLYLDSEYMLMGIYQMLPFDGSGKTMVNFTDTTMVVKVRGALMKRKEDFYFMNHETTVNVDVKDSSAKFENLFSGDDEKSHISEHLINMHSSEILKELKPALETVVSMLFDDVANKFFRNISFDKLFPKD